MACEIMGACELAWADSAAWVAGHEIWDERSSVAGALASAFAPKAAGAGRCGAFGPRSFATTSWKSISKRFVKPSRGVAML